jgi:hypothetical protein
MASGPFIVIDATDHTDIGWERLRGVGTNHPAPLTKRALLPMVVLSILQGAGCGDKSSSNSMRSDPGSLIVKVEGSSTRAATEASSYCVMLDEVDQCGDGGTVATENLTRLNVPPGRQQLRFESPHTDAQIEVTVCKIRLRRACRQIGESRTMSLAASHEIALERGDYRLSAFLTWPRGDAQYAWKIVVR